MELSKSDFAAHINVSAGRVSQMLTAGIIGQDCLVGQGRSAKIDVEKAVRQISLRRDIGQSLGNGIGTQLTMPDEPMAPKPSKTDDLAQQLQQERLESERRKNRIAASEELVRQGQLVPADQVRASMTKLARQVDEENGAMLADFASEIASKFGLVQRDVLHLLRQVRNEKKGAAAERARARAAELPATVEIVVTEAVEA
ncbi:hypothetical protein [Devosia sp. Root635]|uniref:hypothetical protein n=1 Tax=Devosia sp. Root635 TaxID=1736575 RepID=UPI00070013AC|nr:hypothetical protein [Devosia sp. Root635]KRA44687.1 hypothetical protein ASD80_05975 [Devosia sp. Root635]